jgi:hypothetical protein
MLERLIEGEQDPVKLADFAQGQLRGKISELQKALQGHVTEHHRFMLELLWKQLAQQEELIAELDRRIEEHTPFCAEIERLDAVPGVDRRVAETLLAEVGADMKPFPSHQHLASWVGLCPGNEESAGKTSPAAHHPRQSLAETNSGASRLGSEPHQEHLLGVPVPTSGGQARQETRPDCGGPLHPGDYLSYAESGTSYADLGADFFDRLEPERLTRYYVKRLESLGHTITLQTG